MNPAGTTRWPLVLPAAVVLAALALPAAGQDQNYIYFANSEGPVYRALPDGSSPEAISSIGSWGLDVDRQDRKLYVTRRRGSGTIYRMNLDGSGSEVFMDYQPIEGPWGMLGVEVDRPTGKVYWGSDAGVIRRANLDGSDVEDVVTGLDLPWDMDVDPVEGKLYWIDAGTEKVQRSNLDGSGIEDLVTGLASFPMALTLDHLDRKVYWTDYNNHELSRANLDGSNWETVLTVPGLADLYGVALDPMHDRMFLTYNGSTFAVASADFPSGANLTPMLWDSQADPPLFEVSAIATDYPEVPEPIGVLLLGAGAMALLTRRR